MNPNEPDFARQPAEPEMYYDFTRPLSPDYEPYFGGFIPVEEGRVDLPQHEIPRNGNRLLIRDMLSHLQEANAIAEYLAQQ